MEKALEIGNAVTYGKVLYGLMKMAAIIQARLGSYRLPRKVMRDIAGKPMLERVIDRVKPVVPHIIVATPDEELMTFVSSQNVSGYLGSELDVLDRYYQAAKEFNLCDIIRITADCPLIDSGVIASMVEQYEESDYDYFSNCLVRTFPKGLDVEIFNFETLEKAWMEATDPYDREHVTPYIYHYPEIFCLGNFENRFDLSQFRWTVDYQEDLDFVRQIYSNLGEDFTMHDVLEYQQGGVFV